MEERQVRGLQHAQKLFLLLNDMQISKLLDAIGNEEWEWEWE